MLHIAFERLDRFSPGNIYVFPLKKKPNWVPGNRELAEDMVNSNKKDIISASRRILLEASAVCDHAQKNIRVARFVAGLIVPATERRRMKKAGFIWTFGPLFLKPPLVSKEGEYYFYLSARHGVTQKLDQMTDLIAVARLRTQAFSDLQAWYSHHSARPGMVMLHER